MTWKSPGWVVLWCTSHSGLWLKRRRCTTITRNFLSEGVRCGLDMKIARMGHTFTYFPFGLLIERSQMRRYHKKLNFTSEGVRLGLDMKKLRMDSTFRTFHSELWLRGREWPLIMQNFWVEGCRYNARQKSRRWAVLNVLLIVGTFC